MARTTRSSHQWPKPPSMRDFLEDDAVALLRSEGGSQRAVRERLSARMYLIQHGWTVDEINAAQDEDNPGDQTTA